MCMSVPQIAVRCTLMSTSLWPTDGSGTSSSQMPGSARALTNAFMPCPWYLMNDGEIPSRHLERMHDPVELFPGVCSTHLGANSRFSMRHDRKREGHDIDALGLHPLRQIDRQGRVAQHDRNDRVFARNQIESRALHLFAEVAGVGVQ